MQCKCIINPFDVTDNISDRSRTCLIVGVNNDLDHPAHWQYTWKESSLRRPLIRRLFYPWITGTSISINKSLYHFNHLSPSLYQWYPVYKSSTYSVWMHKRYRWRGNTVRPLYSYTYNTHCTSYLRTRCWCSWRDWSSKYPSKMSFQDTTCWY